LSHFLSKSFLNGNKVLGLRRKAEERVEEKGRRRKQIKRERISD
jgi:hypothetical protein